MPKVVKKKYTQENINAALKDMKNGMSLREATQMYHVPRSTLYCKAKNIYPVECSKGPPTILTKEEESRITEWIIYCCDRGFPISRNQLLDSVHSLVTELKRSTPFTNNKPGRHWYEGFRRRHPELCLRVAQNLTRTRASATENVLRNWFAEVYAYLQKKDLVEIDSSRVFNCDESAFFLCPKADQVIAKRGSKSVYKVIDGDEKENLTTLFMVNAKGEMAPPMILYWYKRMPYSITSKIPSGWSIGSTEKGWMTAQSFYEYITNVFHPWLVAQKISMPIILYVDGHSSHLTMPLSAFCRENGIELVALYPNATHILQPLDVSVFHPLKQSWKKTVDKWRLDNAPQRVRKENFAPLLKEAVDSINLAEIVKNGFKTCGLWPFSADAVNYNILNKNKKQKEVPEEQIEHSINEINSYEEDCKKHLKFFEKHISNDILRTFNNAELHESPDLFIDIKNKGLYEYWKMMKRLSGKFDI